MTKKARPYPHHELHASGLQRTFSGPELLQIAMPLGGIGAGCVCLNGHGGLQDFSIRNKPDLTAMPDAHTSGMGTFGLVHIKGQQPVTRLLEGPLPVGKIYDQGLQSQGFRKGGYQGLPRFADCRFTGHYPFGEVRLRDKNVPLQVTITAWSPFIPGDDINSSLPCAIIEYTFENTSRKPVEFEFSYHSTHFAPGPDGMKDSRNHVIARTGVLLDNTAPPWHEKHGSTAIGLLTHTPKIKAEWFRGGWFDSISALWREISEGRFQPNKGSAGLTAGAAPAHGASNGGSVLVPATLAAGASATYAVVFAWHFPNSNEAHGEAACDTGCECPPITIATPRWRPFYARHWRDAGDVALYVKKNYHSLRARTEAFKNALFGSTLPPSVLDAVSANLGILKSPTVLRQENGNVWAWEGCFATGGCCHGSCTHVWNYAQALPHLFPALERTLREQELERSMNDMGHVNFRAALPDGPPPHAFHAAADGQLGGIMKLYRDWQISGDEAWMEGLYPLAKRSLDYCVEAWDPSHKGALFEPHHNTYDIEFWGPDGMCSSIYLGALTALAAMAEHLGRFDEAGHYRAIAERGAAYLDRELYNGEFFAQKVLWRGLRDDTFEKSIAGAVTDETSRLLKKEGPKYQYGSGCLSDGVIGAWMASLYGLKSPQTREHIRRNLKSIFSYNFRADLNDHACLQRPGYALGHEPGLLLCSWPHGGKPTLPFVYSDEVWTGIEYQVAAHLIAEGMVDEGLTIVRAARSRYDGRVRNPWNEYECGNYYARALSSYALLQALSGFRYSAATLTLWLAPRLEQKQFRCFFAVAGGFGTVRVSSKQVLIEIVEGELAVGTLRLEQCGEEKTYQVDVTARPGEPARIRL